MKNKKVALIIGLALVTIAAVGYWYMGSRGNGTEPVTFSAIGSLTQQGERGATSPWYVSEETGSSRGAISKLLINKKSVCIFGETTYPCTTIALREGDRAMVRGNKKSSGSIEVVSLRFVSESATRQVGLLIPIYYYHEATDRKRSGDGPLLCSEDSLKPVLKEVFVSNTEIQDALTFLLNGNVAIEDRQAGFNTFFPQGTLAVSHAVLEDGTLTLEFSGEMSSVQTHPCAKQLVPIQIEKTAKEFDGVKKITVIPEGVLQK